MKAKRVDVNQKEIVKVLRELGCSVAHLHECGKGIPDLLVGIDNQTHLIEVKKDAKASFTPAQVEFQGNWKGSPVIRINSVEEAIAFVKNMV